MLTSGSLNYLFLFQGNFEKANASNPTVRSYQLNGNDDNGKYV